MKKALSLLLCIVMVMTPVMAVASAADEYYPAYTQGNYPTIMNALSSLGIDGSYNSRKQIAAANNITNFTGSNAQNHTMLALLMAGRLRKAGTKYATPTAQAGCYAPYTGPATVSIVDAMKSKGLSSSFGTRKIIAEYNSIGVKGANGQIVFTGTAAQNARMLGLYMTGQLKMPPKTSTTTTVSASASKDGCYKVPSIQTVSIVDALKSIGVDSSYAHRKRIAEKANTDVIAGKGYNGEAAENIAMLVKLYSGTLKMAA